MHVDTYTETLRRTLVETSSLGDDRTQDVARSLAAALEPALRLVALQMLTDTADELNSELDGAHVAVVMDGATPHLLVTQADRSDEREQDHVTGPDRHAQTPAHAVPEVADGPEVRTTLRMPESLKQQIDAAARVQGRSVNAWLVEAARGALSEQSLASGSQRPPSTGNDGAGSDRSASGSDGGRPTDWRARPAQHRSAGATLSGWFG
ncbi:Arc family DNA-binding protein [Actinomyces sp. oral taxon 169]|uniref:Arc family DNA-binding protein n=1 Tax=Actinomyces sp. oral taxon 169 TaxID=712116 RepID=UPI0015FE9892|nr:Arc family DNA-binding protein [Actinomyces sp. oral taxon 169]QLF53508.1 Arc family DNA-binding protein [Actinomyces sp. oral taxon 169]